MIPSPSTTSHARNPRTQRYRFWRLLRANFYDLLLLLRDSWVVLAGFGLLVVIGTVYIYFRYDEFSLAGATYETLKLLALESDLVLPRDRLGQLLFFLIPLFGLALILQGVLNFGRLLLDKNSRREAWQVALASTYTDHIVICGLGRVSFRIVTQLIDAGYEVVVVEQNWESEFVERALRRKVPVVLGDAREPEVLRQAGITRAQAVVAGINEDLLNVEIALTARTLNQAIRVVLRVFNDELERSLERAFGPNTVFSTSALAAPTFAIAAVSRQVDFVLPIGEEFLGITKLEIQSESDICGFVRAIEDDNNIRVIRHQDQLGRELQPGIMRQLNGGDQVLLLGSINAIESLRAKNVHGSKLDFLRATPIERPNLQLQTVILCGLGKVSYRVVSQLQRMEPRPNVVVIQDANRNPDFTRHIRELDGVTTLIGDPRDVDILRKAGIEQAYSVVALSSNNLLNLQIALAARRCCPDVHIVMRVFSEALADKLADMLGIRTTYSTSGLSGPTLAAAAIIGDVTHAFFSDKLLFSADEIVISTNNPLIGSTIDTIRNTYHATVVGLKRDNVLHVLPTLDNHLQEGDEIILLAHIDALNTVREVLTKETPPSDSIPSTPINPPPQTPVPNQSESA